METECVLYGNGMRFVWKRNAFCHKTQPGIDDCPRSQHYVCRRTQENEGDANKNYFVSLGSVAWLSQELSFFMTSLITLQFECESEHSGTTAEAVVVGVGIDAVEDGVGVAALV